MTAHEFLGFAYRFAAKLTPTADGHLLWTGSQNGNGYGQIWLGDGMVLAHRVAWVLAHGRDPNAGLDLDHTCRQRNCVNPDCLAEISHAENVLIGTGPSALNAAKLLCDRGHLLAGDNLLVLPRGDRVCIKCDEFRNRRTRARRKLARLEAAYFAGSA
ncbi:HNH endonuclease signature motif containing protein [Rhodococcus oryzae]|uniref:HNH endonuclease signature motif containing protein n=1 Tax=Rhodococcus oryzae TaxID=2571143 RepID=UPI00371140B5